MKTVTADDQMPPGGWKLTVPETGVTIHAPYAKTLLKRVGDHRAANGLPAMERPAFEDAACTESGHGAPWCGGVRGPVKPPTTLSRVKSFLRAMVAVAKTRDLVDAAEHARRLAICKECPMNSINGLGCHGCIDDLREVEKHVGKMPVGNVEVCSACGGCLCWVKGWISNPTLDAAEATAPVTYPENCWRHGV